MNILILDKTRNEQVIKLNQSGDPLRRLQPMPLPDGRLFLNADLLGDCGPGQTWERYATALQALPIDTIDAATLAGK